MTNNVYHNGVFVLGKNSIYVGTFLKHNLLRYSENRQSEGYFMLNHMHEIYVFE